MLFVQEKRTGRKKYEIKEDLEIIRSRWKNWWLCSAASDQDWLLTEIKNIDQMAFYQNYAINIAWKVLYPIFNELINSLFIDALQSNLSIYLGPTAEIYME